MILHYYLREKSGEPSISELMKFQPYIYETLAMGAKMAHDIFFSKKEFPSEIRFDSLTRTVRRKTCRKNNFYIYETYFDMGFGEVFFLSICCGSDFSIVLSCGKRGRNVNVNRLSDFPYLKETIDRAPVEFQIEASNFDWKMDQSA